MFIARIRSEDDGERTTPTAGKLATREFHTYKLQLRANPTHRPDFSTANLGTEHAAIRAAQGLIIHDHQLVSDNRYATDTTDVALPTPE